MNTFSQAPVALGLDFGTECVRAVLIDAAGSELGVGLANYPHGQILQTLPGTGRALPPRFALQCPKDWIESSAVAVRDALAAAAIDPASVVGIGVDFTSCTMLPAKRDGTPLCELDDFRDRIFAWPKLWKHHGAISETERMNEIAKQRGESFLNRYGG